ncbi:DUF2486 family protein [Paraburkholderia kirstenboschensis]|uniref:DUF2486 family protein n=1 Tax=Paraburkholderia kirstenboschensis TaxID=1245436 RepID=A0ABZ0ENL7_9BURK|nr:DUF2486 family protein [Paraburkholderia kirstenboschensis]WOD18760.1 DUF2486 family protein [Paraburkholderia kirstenboschensis]
MSDPNDNSIPVLNEVLVPGHVAQRREPQAGAAAPAAAPAETPLPEAEALLQPDVTTEPELAPQPVLSPEETRAPEPVLEPQPLGTGATAAAAGEARSTAGHAHSADHGRPADQAHPAHHAHAMKKPRPHLAAKAGHAHDDALAASAAMFDRTEPPPPFEAAATVPPDIAQEVDTHGQSGVDAERIAERLRERFAGFLAGDGRGVIEARCRSAVEEHATRLVDQITREVVSTLENQMTGWVREAVEAEIDRRSGGA